MKILIFSDTHGNSGRVEELLNIQTYDVAIFLGDVISDLKNYHNLGNLHIVRGNCDFFANEPLEDFFEIDGIKFFITHGHEYGVKNGLSNLIKAAEKQSANVVCFGHTHNYYEEEANGILYLNPGSLSRVRGGQNCYMLIETNNKKIKVNKLTF